MSSDSPGLEASAATALQLTHQAQHGADMHPAQLRRLAALASLHGLVATIGDRAANETCLNRLLGEVMGHKLARLVCSMHAVDNAAQLVLLIEKVLEIARAHIEELARAHGKDVSVMLGPAMATALERAIDNIGGYKQRGPQQAAELLNFTMGSRFDSLNAIFKMEFNLSQVAEELDVRLQPFNTTDCLMKKTQCCRCAQAWHRAKRVQPAGRAAG